MSKGPEPIKRLLRLFCGLGVLFSLAGCGPTFHAYRYLSLEDYADARVIERARATPGEHRFFVGEIPTRYEIEREGYTLILVVHPTDWYPGLGLTIRPYPERRVRANRTPAPCTSWANSEGSAWWVYDIHRCTMHEPPARHGRLRFQVLDPDGRVVAEEDIPYTIEKDGFFVYTDAI